MKYYDRHGETHNSIFSTILANIKNGNRSEISLTIENPCVDLMIDNQKSIKIDYQNNRICLIDSDGNIIRENEIDPKLRTRMTNSDIHLDKIDPKLNDPEYVEHILNSDRLKQSISVFESLMINDHHASNKKIMIASTLLSSSAINAVMDTTPDVMQQPSGISKLKKVLEGAFSKAKIQ